MAVSPDKTLILILQHKAAYLDFVDLIDNPEGDMLLGDTQIPIPFYNRKISALAQNIGRVDGRRLVDALSLENLHRNGFLLDWNRKDGYLTLKPWLVEMLRHLDNSRLKELTDKDLENLRSQLANMVDLLQAPGLIMARGHPDFAELVARMFKTLNEVDDDLQKNIYSLSSQSKQLSSILDSQDVITLDRAQQMREALESVYVLQERHIKPMLQFIDEQQDYKDRKNPIAMIQRLESRMQGCGFPEYTSRLVNIRIRILSHGKKIKEISRLLRRYIRQDKDERVRYNKIEGAFNGLLSACRETLRDGNQRTRFIPLTHPVFDSGQSLFGLKSHSQTARTRLSWQQDGQYAGYLHEKVRAYQEGVRKRINKPQYLTATGEVDPLNKERARRTMQVQRLVEALEIFTYQGPVADTHTVVHEYLEVVLENYWLGDLVESIPLIKSSNQFVFSYQRTMQEIEYGGYCLRYLTCMMEPA
ncbi:MAG: hypothetical protein RPU52_13355 [Candidatus Sedimenticola sp. (ex Thyasira tokunagai)]